MSSSMADVSSGIPAWAKISDRRRSHIERVAVLLRDWAGRLDVDGHELDRWLRGAYLHDALKDAPEDELRRLAGPLFDHSQLLHGPAAAEMARAHGEQDQGVLDAIRYHSVGYAGWNQTGRMLYLADYLEPGRRMPVTQRAERVARVPASPAVVLREVAQERIIVALSSGKPLLEQTVAFWNALV